MQSGRFAPSCATSPPEIQEKLCGMFSRNPRKALRYDGSFLTQVHRAISNRMDLGSEELPPETNLIRAEERIAGSPNLSGLRPDRFGYLATQKKGRLERSGPFN